MHPTTRGHPLVCIQDLPSLDMSWRVPFTSMEDREVRTLSDPHQALNNSQDTGSRRHGGQEAIAATATNPSRAGSDKETAQTPVAPRRAQGGPNETGSYVTTSKGGP